MTLYTKNPKCKRPVHMIHNPVRYYIDKFDEKYSNNVCRLATWQEIGLAKHSASNLNNKVHLLFWVINSFGIGIQSTHMQAALFILNWVKINCCKILFEFALL